MQTMIQLDETVLDQATRLAQDKGCDLSQFIEETLRERITPRPALARQPLLRLTTVGGQGLRPGVDLDNSESGCEWVTTDRDYQRFPGLRWRHPLTGNASK